MPAPIRIALTPVTPPQPLPPQGVHALGFEIRTPWMEGHLLMRLPETLSSSLGLHFIDHHRADMPQRSPLASAPVWEQDEDTGAISYHVTTEEGLVFGGTAEPVPEGVRLRFDVRNETGARITGVAHQQCLVTSNAPPFSRRHDLTPFMTWIGGRFRSLAETRPAPWDKGRLPWVLLCTEALAGSYRGQRDWPDGWWVVNEVADTDLLVRESRDLRHLLAMSWHEDASMLMTNTRIPCLHAGPTTTVDLDPGQEAVWNGMIYLVDNDPDRLLALHREHRKLAPASTASLSTMVIDADSVGADPSGTRDSGPALRAAIAQAVEAGPGACVRLGQGTYRVASGPSHGAAIAIEGATGLTLRGQGDATEILLTDPTQGGIVLSDCDAVTVEDLVIDHDPPPFTQGWIREVDHEDGAFVIELQGGFPSLGEPWFASVSRPYGCWGLIFDARERVLKLGAPDFVFIDRWESAGAGRWRLFPVAEERQKLRAMEPGDRYVQLARHGKGGALFATNSRRCSFRNVVIHASQSLAVGAVACDRLTIQGVQIRFRQDTERLITTDADAIHLQQHYRGPIIEDCFAEGMADDAINIYYYPSLVREVLSATELLCSVQGMEVGDLLQVFDPRSGRLVGESRLAAIEKRPGAVRILTLTEPISGVTAGATHQEADTVFNLSRCGRGFIIRNCHFRNHRRHGMMIKAPGGLIENNVIEGVGGWGIVLGNDVHWPEGVVPGNVVVRGNTIRGIGRSQYYAETPSGAAIQIKTDAFSRPAGSHRLARGIQVEANTIEDPPGAAITVSGAENVTISDLDVRIGPQARMLRDTPAVSIENTSKARVERLTVQSSSPRTTAALEIGPAVAPGSAGITVDDIRLRGSEGCPAVLDRRPTPVP